jgi:hypothetical protein
MVNTLRLNARDSKTPWVALPRLCASLVCRPYPIKVVVVERIGRYTYDLGVALLQNSSVTSICLCVYDLVRLYEDGSTYAVRPLLKYIATSQALTRVEFSSGAYGRSNVLDRLLHAAAKNSNIVEVAADDNICVAAEALTTFVTTTRSIRKMSVCIGRFDPANTRETLAAAFGQIQTLQDLAITANTFFDQGAVQRILSELDSRSSNLCALRIRAGEGTPLPQLTVLARLLRSTQTLSCIGLDSFIIDSDAMKVLLTALQSNQTVTCFKFQHCTISALKTANMFTEFLRSDGCCIQELHIQPAVPAEARGSHRRPFDMVGIEPDDGNFLGTRRIGVTVSKMLVRSSITSLTLLDTVDCVPSYNMLFDRLVRSEATIRLRKLSIKSVSMRVMKSLAQFLAKSSQLRELSVDFPNKSTLSPLLLSGIYRSGSLYSVVWTVSERELAAAAPFCQRNRLVPHLLHSQAQAANTHNSDISDPNGARQIDLCVIPSLFLAARQARMTAPTVMLIGLLTG